MATSGEQVTGADSHGEELFSARVRAGSRTYFIDVQRAANGAKYIKISESRRCKGEERHKRHRVMVFEEHLLDFIDAFHEACLHVPEQPSEVRAVPSQEATPARRNGSEPRWSAARLAEMRKEYPRAYEKWTEQEDARLRAEFAKGTNREELTVLFQRQPSAIKSRLRKLGLLDQPK
jgi:hypothetical protein